MSESPEIVPEFWPPVEPIEPVKPWRVHWLLALPATVPAMLFPRRVGAHLAASSWAAAYVVHVLSVLLFFGAFLAPALEGVLTGVFETSAAPAAYTLAEHVRRPFAADVLFLYGMLNNWIEVGIFWLVVGVVEVGMWVAALALIPLYAAGEQRARLYLRCVKLLLWSTMCLIPLGVVVFPVGEWLGEDLSGEWVALFVAGWAFWWFTVLVRLGGRYAGPKTGPRWSPRTPTCESCGYTLTGLPVNGRCPECGRAVQDSLPERRRLPAFASARWPSEWIIGFVQTTWAALAERRFARGVSVWRGYRAARNYAFVVCLLIGLLCACGTAPFWPPDDVDFQPFSRPAMSLVAGITAFSCGVAWLLVAGVGVTGFGFRHAAARVVVLYYSTAWLLVVALLGLAGAWAIYVIHYRFHPHGFFDWPVLRWIEKELFIAAWVMMPAVVTLILSFFRVRWMLRETRYANG
ncbi:MAG TPA: hypothetical protein VM487_04015 [Phycisphaerae bacterium]|nr:hypothetical protein [Phycisphaerae bacterium]